MSIKTDVLLAAALVGAGFGAGWYVTSDHYQAQASRAALASEKALAEATEAVAVKERDLNTMLARAAENQIKEQSRHDEEIHHLQAAVRTGAVRLSVPVAGHCAPATSPHPAPAAEPGSQERAELVPEAAADLVGIAADGDAAILQLNAVIDAYASIQQACGTESVKAK